MEPIVLKALKSDDLPDFRALLGGAEFGGCFCAVWTSFDETWQKRCQDPAQPNYERTAARVRAGEKTGYLAFQGADLVAWTGAGPKSQFPFLAEKLGSRLSPTGPDIWAIGCMAIKQEYRGTGLSGRLLAAVIAAARAAGAAAVEAYPTRPWDEPRSFRGSESLYCRMGFKEIAKEADDETEILVMQLNLT